MTETHILIKLKPKFKFAVDYNKQYVQLGKAHILALQQTLPINRQILPIIASVHAFLRTPHILPRTLPPTQSLLLINHTLVGALPHRHTSLRVDLQIQLVWAVRPSNTARPDKQVAVGTGDAACGVVAGFAREGALFAQVYGREEEAAGWAGRDARVLVEVQRGGGVG